jgi:hypothetical protein
VTDGSSGFDIVATVTSSAAAVDASSVFLSFRTNGGAYTDVLMSATGNPNEYSASIPAVSDQNTTVDYYLSAADVNGNVRSNPNPGIAAPYTFDVAFFLDDLESGAAGWTLGVAGDNATTGQWALADPIGSAAQPEDDATAGAGTMALITQQCCGGCTLGCADVDGGTTTLLSPVWDLSEAETARVRFDAWYSNIQGAAPTQDDWVIDVSNDGGGSWTNFVNTKQSNESWTVSEIDVNALFGAPDQVRLRFRASDLGEGSIVSARVCRDSECVRADSEKS